MKNIVIAAGYATRLGELTKNFPKPLLKIGENTILGRMLDDIDKIPEIDEHIIITNHKFAGIFEEWASKQSYTKPVTIVDDGTETNDTRLGAVCDLLFAMDKLKIDDEMLVVAADNILFFSFQEFVDFAKEKGTSCIMCHEQSLVEPLAQVMAKLGVTKGMVVFGQDKLDEISMSAPTSVCEIKDGWFQSYEITPEQFGYERCSKEDLAGGTPAENAEITRAILKGEEKGPKRQAVCLNAGAALYIAGKAESLEAGVRMAEELIDNGSAMKKLEEFIRESNA